MIVVLLLTDHPNVISRSDRTCLNLLSKFLSIFIGTDSIRVQKMDKRRIKRVKHIFSYFQMGKRQCLIKTRIRWFLSQVLLFCATLHFVSMGICGVLKTFERCYHQNKSEKKIQDTPLKMFYISNSEWFFVVCVI